MARAHSLVVESLMDDEENQVYGYSHVNDESGLTMGHLSAWSLNDIRNMLRCIQNSTPMRHKETHFINIPGCATKIIEFAISLLNEKLRSRILVSIQFFFFFHNLITNFDLRIWFCIKNARRSQCFLRIVSTFHLTQVHKNLDHLREAIDPKILPKEYGGEVPLADMIGKKKLREINLIELLRFGIIRLFYFLHFTASFKKELRSKRDQLKALDDMYIEISKESSCSNGTNGQASNDALATGISGSFRKLEVDWSSSLSHSLIV